MSDTSQSYGENRGLQPSKDMLESPDLIERQQRKTMRSGVRAYVENLNQEDKVRFKFALKIERMIRYLKDYPPLLEATKDLLNSLETTAGSFSVMEKLNVFHLHLDIFCSQYKFEASAELQSSLCQLLLIKAYGDVGDEAIIFMLTPRQWVSGKDKDQVSNFAQWKALLAQSGYPHFFGFGQYPESSFKVAQQAFSHQIREKQSLIKRCLVVQEVISDSFHPTTDTGELLVYREALLLSTMINKIKQIYNEDEDEQSAISIEELERNLIREDKESFSEGLALYFKAIKNQIAETSIDSYSQVLIRVVGLLSLYFIHHPRPTAKHNRGVQMADLLKAFTASLSLDNSVMTDPFETEKKLDELIKLLEKSLPHLGKKRAFCLVEEALYCLKLARFEIQGPSNFNPILNEEKTKVKASKLSNFVARQYLDNEVTNGVRALSEQITQRERVNQKLTHRVARLWHFVKDCFVAVKNGVNFLKEIQLGSHTLDRTPTIRAYLNNPNGFFKGLKENRSTP